METKQYTTMDKSTWPRGAWDHEPDKVQWEDPATGLPCLIVRGQAGNLCGYVGVPPSHPWHGKGYSQRIDECTLKCEQDEHYSHSIDSRIRVHGGLTFAASCEPGDDEARGICHIPGSGEADHAWWYGFDCAHCFDLCPAYANILPSLMSESEYRDLAYVRAEVTALAAQLAAVRAA